MKNYIIYILILIGGVFIGLSFRSCGSPPSDGSKYDEIYKRLDSSFTAKMTIMNLIREDIKKIDSTIVNKKFNYNTIINKYNEERDNIHRLNANDQLDLFTRNVAGHRSTISR